MVLIPEFIRVIPFRLLPQSCHSGPAPGVKDARPASGTRPGTPSTQVEAEMGGPSRPRGGLVVTSNRAPGKCDLKHKGRCRAITLPAGPAAPAGRSASGFAGGQHPLEIAHQRVENDNDSVRGKPAQNGVMTLDRQRYDVLRAVPRARGGELVPGGPATGVP